jgi:hypothetical protein
MAGFDDSKRRGSGTSSAGKGTLVQRSTAAPGKRTRTETLPPSSDRDEASVVQRRAEADATNRAAWEDADPQATAADGVASATAALPHHEQIQASFGKHDVSHVRSQIGGDAAVAARGLGASAFAFGDRVGFASAPDLHTAAHEAAHVVQQSGGVQLEGGIDGGADDPHEQHADAVADAVVAGRSAEALLDERAGGAPTATVQRKIDPDPSVGAGNFVQWFYSDITPQVMHAIVGIKMVPSGPYGAAFQKNSEFQTELLNYFTTKIGGENAGHLLDGFALFIAPEPIEPIVDRARGHDWDTSDEDNPKEKRDVGPASPTYAAPVAVELANAMARRYVESMTKLMPIATDLWLHMLSDQARAAGKDIRTFEFPPIRISLGHVPAGHPMDIAVKQTFENVATIDFRAIVTEPQWKKWIAYEKDWGTDRGTPIFFPGTKPVLRPVALDFKAKEGKYHWVEASLADATAEEVAAVLFNRSGPEDSDAATQNAFRLIPVPPLWGFHGEDVLLFAPAHVDTLRAQYDAAMRLQPINEQGAQLEPPWPQDMANRVAASRVKARTRKVPESDPIAELSADQDRAMDQAKANATPEQTDNKDAASVVAVLGDDLRVVDTIARRLLACDADLAAILSVRDQLYQTLVAWQMSSLPDPGLAHALALQQGAVLGDIAEGVNEVAVKYQMYAQPVDGNSPDVSIVELFRDALTPYNDALRAIAFPEVARTRVQLGLQRTATLDISVQEAALHGGMPSVDAELHKDPDKKTNAFDAAAAARRTNELAYDLGATRMQMARDPAAARAQLGDQSNKVGELEFDISLGDKLARLNDFWRAVDDEEGFWESLPDELQGRAIKQRCAFMRLQLLTAVIIPYEASKKANNRDGMMAARQAFANLIKNEFIPFANEVRDFVKRTEKHKKWSKIIAGILIAVVAFAFGQFEFAALIDLGAGWIEASVAAGIVTTTTSIVLEKLILNQDPTLGSIIMGFAGNIAIFGYMGKMAMAAKAAGVAAEVSEATVGAAAKTAEIAGTAEAAKGSGAFANAIKSFSIEMVFGEVFMLLSAEGTSLIDNKRTLTGSEFFETAGMAVVNIIGMKVGQFGFDKTIDALKVTMRGGGPQIEQLITMRNDLIRDGFALRDTAGGPGKIAKGKPAPRAQAQALLDKWQAYFEKERAVTEEVLALADKHPEMFRAKAKELEQLKTNDLDAEALTRKLRQARALLGVEEMAPGLYRADPKAMDAILAEHKASGSEVVSVTTDPVTGQRTLRIVAADGTPFELVEKLADVGERKAPKVSVGAARHFEEWLAGMPVDTPEAVKIRSRLTEYYARDPEAAIALAQRQYRYPAAELPTPELMPGVPDVPQPLAPEAPKTKGKGPKPDVKPGVPAEKSAAQRAYEHYQYTREGKKTSTPGDEELSRADFENYYKAGYEYDPITERWATRDGKTPDTPARDLEAATDADPELAAATRASPAKETTASAVAGSDFKGGVHPASEAHTAEILATATRVLHSTARRFRSVRAIEQASTEATYVVTTADGKPFTIRLTSGPLGSDAVARTIVNTTKEGATMVPRAGADPIKQEVKGRYVIQLSETIDKANVERALAHEVGEILAERELSDAHLPPTADVLKPGTPPPGAKLSPHDHGRVAEIKVLADRVNARDAHATRELLALVEELGLRDGTPGAAERRQLVFAELADDAHAREALEKLSGPEAQLDAGLAAQVESVKHARAEDITAAQTRQAGRTPIHDLPVASHGGVSIEEAISMATAAKALRDARSMVTAAKYRALASNMREGEYPVVDDVQVGGGASLAARTRGALLVDARGRWQGDAAERIAQTANQLRGLKDAGIGDPFQFAAPDERVPVAAIRYWEDTIAAGGDVIDGRVTNIEIDDRGRTIMTIAPTDNAGPIKVQVRGNLVMSTGFPIERIPGTPKTGMTPDKSIARIKDELKAIANDAHEDPARKAKAQTAFDQIDHLVGLESEPGQRERDLAAVKKVLHDNELEEVVRHRAADAYDMADAGDKWNKLRQDHPDKFVLGDDANLEKLDARRTNKWLIGGASGTGISAAEIVLARNPSAHVTMVGDRPPPGLIENDQFLAVVRAHGDAQTVALYERLGGIRLPPGDGRFTLVLNVDIDTPTIDGHGDVHLAARGHGRDFVPPGYSAENNPLEGGGYISSIGRENQLPAVAAELKLSMEKQGGRLTMELIWDADSQYVGYRLKAMTRSREVVRTLDVTGAASRYPPWELFVGEDITTEKARFRRASDLEAPPESGNFDGGFVSSAKQAERYARHQAARDPGP